MLITLKKIEISPNALMENDLIRAVGSWLDYPKNASFSREVRFEIICKIYSEKKYKKNIYRFEKQKKSFFE